MAVKAIHSIDKHFNDNRKKIRGNAAGELGTIFPELPATNEM
jgi:hypothetical protein